MNKKTTIELTPEESVRLEQLQSEMDAITNEPSFKRKMNQIERLRDQVGWIRFNAHNRTEGKKKAIRLFEKFGCIFWGKEVDFYLMEIPAAIESRPDYDKVKKSIHEGMLLFADDWMVCETGIHYHVWKGVGD